MGYLFRSSAIQKSRDYRIKSYPRLSHADNAVNVCHQGNCFSRNHTYLPFRVAMLSGACTLTCAFATESLDNCLAGHCKRSLQSSLQRAN